MQRIAELPRKPAPVHAVIRLQMPNRRFHRLPPLEPAALLPGQRLVLAPVDDLDIGVVFINAAIAQIDNDLLRRLARVLQQNRGLLQLPVEDVSVVRIPRKGSRADDQPALVGDGNAGLE